jgi:NAD-dependent dihydropyrimidine dehydrogenase PreA subunit
MITIRVDEDACVGCSLCVDMCPTDVFSFDDDKRLPVVEKAEMCFGCLSCSEICPSDAIDHEDVSFSDTFYHHTYPLDLAAKLGTGRDPAPGIVHDSAKMNQGIQDLGVRLLSVASVLKQTVGGAIPALGKLAGQTLASQLPRYQAPESFEEVLELMKEQFSPTWDLSVSQNGNDSLCIDVGECFVRDVCKKEGIELGGELCTLFYNYLAGYLSKMGGVRLRLTSADRGAKQCTYDIEVRD